MHWFLINDQRDAQFVFDVFISIYNSLHVSSTSCLSSGETNCINTTSGNSHSMLVAEMCVGWKKTSTCREAGTWDRFFYFPYGGRHAENFYARKIQRFRPGLNPQTWVPEASMLTTRPPKPSWLLPKAVLIQFVSPDDEHDVLETCRDL